eukprot:4440352-Prymnesium_polylepis.1
MVSRNCSRLQPTQDHGQHPEGVREVLRVDRDDRAGELAFEPCAGASSFGGSAAARAHLRGVARALR